MSYQVAWTRQAEDDLARIWLRSRVRAWLTESLSFVDGQLQRDPSAIGESRDQGRRIIVHSPLAFLVEIDDARRQVRVLTVWESQNH